MSFESRVHFQLISLSDPESRATSLKAGIHTISLDHYFHHVSASLIRDLSHIITETSKMTGHIRYPQESPRPPSLPRRPGLVLDHMLHDQLP